MKALFNFAILIMLLAQASYASDQLKSNTLIQAVLENNPQKILTLLKAGEDINPVSYTHLDVYKRQGLSFPLEMMTRFTCTILKKYHYTMSKTYCYLNISVKNHIPNMLQILV